MYNNIECQTILSNILLIVINRPEKLNALNHETLSELNTVLDTLINDSTLKGAIITGSGKKAFVAGADIKEIAQLNEPEGVKASKFGQDIFFKIENCSKLIIAAVNGYALGGGCELAMACHFRIASENAIFGQPEINLGIIPGYGGTQRLTQLIGKGKALELLLTADNINAQEALKLGLVNHVVSQENLLSKAEEIFSKYLNKPMTAASKIIDSVNAYNSTQLYGYEKEAIEFGKCTITDNFKEGTSAFLEKRKANFQ